MSIATAALCALMFAGSYVATDASAFWTGTGDLSVGRGAAASTSVKQGATPSAVQRGSGGVQVSWGASETDGGQVIDRYTVTRRNAASGLSVPATTGCAGVVAATSCLETGIVVGVWTYTVTPLLGTNWRGSASSLSGEISTGVAHVDLDRTVFGAPLPLTVTGQLTGFVAGEGITYLVDGVAAAGGSPAVVDASGNATFVFSLPVGIVDGSHSIHVVGNDAVAATSATASLLIDTAPPITGRTLSPPANAAGWNTTSVRLSGTVNDGTGSGLAGTYYTIDGSDPRTSPTAALEVAELRVTSSRTVRFYSVDVAGNGTGVDDVVVKIDRIAPTFVASIGEHSGGVYTDTTRHTTYYRGADAGSFRLLVDVLDPGGSGPASFSSPDLTETGFTHVGGTFATPIGGPYLDSVVSWVAGTSSLPEPIVSVADIAGNVLTVTGRALPDDTAPAGGFVQVAGVPAGAAGYSNTTVLRVNMVDATDDGSGLLTNGRRLLRATAPLTAVNDRVSCGAYGAYAEVSASSGASFDDVVAPSTACYRYRVEASDNVGNIGRFDSNEIRVQLSGDGALAPSAVAIAPISGLRYQSTSGTVVYYNPAWAGSFAVGALASDSASGVSSFVFPVMSGFVGGGAVIEPASGGAWRMIYAWSGNGAAAAPGVQALSATNGAGITAVNAAAFDVRRDVSAPTGASVSVAGLVGTGARYATSQQLTINIVAGVDGGSGIDSAGAYLARASASLTSGGTANGVCGAFGEYVAIARAPGATLVDAVPTDGTCYRYRYTAADRVANESDVFSVDVKVQTTSPTLALGVSALTSTSWAPSTSTVYYRPSAPSGSVTVTAQVSETVAGIASFGFPTFPVGWTSTAPASSSRTFTWSAPAPGATVGAQVVTATSHAGLTGVASFVVVADSTAPAGGSATYVTGLRSVGSVTVAVATGSDAGSGVDLASGRLFRSSATLSAGACGAFGGRVSVGASTGATDSIVDASVASGTCNRYEFDVADRVGNVVTYASGGIVMVDRVAPTQVLSLVSPLNAFFMGSTIYFRGGVAGSFRIATATTDSSVVSSVVFPAVVDSGFTHTAETVASATAGVFTSSTFSFTTSAVAPTPRTVTATDQAGNVGSQMVNFERDAIAPSGGSISYANGVVNEQLIGLTMAPGTDLGSGLAANALVVRRASASYNPSSQKCGTFGVFATVASAVGGTDTTVLTNNCYMYQLLVSDAVGNQVTYTSASIARVDTTGPRVTAITSQQSSGAAGNGRLELGDKLILTFDQSLSATGAPSYVGTLDSVGGGNVLLSIPGLTASPRTTGSTSYLATPGTTASFVVTPALVNNGASTKVTLTVTTLTGANTSIGIGTLVWITDPVVGNAAGSPANSTFTTASTFRLF